MTSELLNNYVKQYIEARKNCKNAYDKSCGYDKLQELGRECDALARILADFVVDYMDDINNIV